MTDRILNITYILIFLCLSVFIGICHDPYANEPQSFLIARDRKHPPLHNGHSPKRRLSNAIVFMVKITSCL